MLVHLLFTALVSGIRSGNVTNSSGREEVRLEGSLEDSILTPLTKPNGTVEPDRAPSSRAADELADLEAELGLPPNPKLNLTTEDEGEPSLSVCGDGWFNLSTLITECATGVQPHPAPESSQTGPESFQEQDQTLRHCNLGILEQHSHSLCGLEFEESMGAIGAQHWCSFDHVIGPYSRLTFCMEQLCALLRCYYPNPSVQDFFLHTHAQFFLHCPEEEVQLTDAPHAMVVALTLGPVTIIPLLVYLVVRKSNGRD